MFPWCFVYPADFGDGGSMWESSARIEIAIHFQHSSGQLSSPADSKLTSSAVSSDPSGDFHHGSSIRMATFRWDQTSKKWQCFSAVVAGLQLHQHFVPPVSLHGKMMDLGSGWRWEVTHEYLTSWGNAASQSISIDVNIYNYIYICTHILHIDLYK